MIPHDPLHCIKRFAAYLFELRFISGLIANEFFRHFSVIYVFLVCQFAQKAQYKKPYCATPPSVTVQPKASVRVSLAACEEAEY